MYIHNTHTIATIQYSLFTNLLTLYTQIRSRHRCLLVFLPPNFGLSKQFLHLPHSGVLHFSQLQPLVLNLFGVSSLLFGAIRVLLLLVETATELDLAFSLLLLRLVNVVCILLLGESTLYFLGRPFFRFGPSSVSAEGSSTLK